MVYQHYSFEWVWVHGKAVNRAILQAENWNSRHLLITSYITAAKRLAILTAEWLSQLQPSYGFEKFILELEANCISNLSPNHTLQLTTLRIPEGVTTSTLQIYDAKLVNLSQMFSCYYIMLQDDGCYNHLLTTDSSCSLYALTYPSILLNVYIKKGVKEWYMNV